MCPFQNSLLYLIPEFCFSNPVAGLRYLLENLLRIERQYWSFHEFFILVRELEFKPLR
jgi:hypothetical protein